MDYENGLQDFENDEINFEIQFNIEEAIENKVALQINNFSKWLKENEYRNSIDSSKYTFGNYEWFIEATVTKCPNDDEEYLGFYIFCLSLNKKK